MASAAASTSVHWRMQGNDFFKSYQKPELANCLKKSYLTDAINSYYRAYNAGNDAEEKSSAAKNVATAAWKLGIVHNDLDSKLSLLHHFHKEAILYFDRALVQGKLVKPENWLTSLKDSLHGCVENALDIVSDMEGEDKIMGLEELTHKMSDENPQKAAVFVEMAQQIFRNGIVALQGGDYKKALCAMKDCYRPTEEARRLAGGREEILNEVKILDEDCFLHQCAAESIQSRNTGDQLLQVVLNDLEDLNMTLVFEVLDWYKKAILLTREKEVEMEAIALSRLGKVYDQVLVMKYKAKDNFLRCVQLAHSLQPRSFTTEDWFQLANRTLEKYQQQVLQQEHVRWQKDRQEHVKALEKELQRLKKHSDEKEDLEFLRYVYRAFPPKKKSHRLPSKKKTDGMGRPELKKLYQKAVIHYHPDKMKEHGDKWVVMCEEITKLLTPRYEHFK